MMTSSIKVVCPKCQSINSYDIDSMQLIDTDLHVTYTCEMCGGRFMDTYALAYLGGYANGKVYDRDNVTIDL